MTRLIVLWLLALVVGYSVYGVVSNKAKQAENEALLLVDDTLADIQDDEVVPEPVVVRPEPETDLGNYRRTQEVIYDSSLSAGVLVSDRDISLYIKKGKKEFEIYQHDFIMDMPLERQLKSVTGLVFDAKGEYLWYTVNGREAHRNVLYHIDSDTHIDTLMSRVVGFNRDKKYFYRCQGPSNIGEEVVVVDASNREEVFRVYSSNVTGGIQECMPYNPLTNTLSFKAGDWQDKKERVFTLNLDTLDFKDRIVNDTSYYTINGAELSLARATVTNTNGKVQVDAIISNQGKEDYQVPAPDAIGVSCTLAYKSVRGGEEIGKAERLTNRDLVGQEIKIGGPAIKYTILSTLNYDEIDWSLVNMTCHLRGEFEDMYETDFS